MFKKLFPSIPRKILDETRYEIYVEMRTALSDYTTALTQYNSMRREFVEPSTIVEIAFATVEHYRVRYYNLRIRYEELYDDKTMYEESLSNLENLATKAGVQLLMRPQANPFLYNRQD